MNEPAHKPTLRGDSSILLICLLVLGAATHSAVGEAPDAAAALQLKGVVTIGDVSIFSIHDAETGRFIWLKEGASRGQLTALAFSTSDKLLTVRWYDHEYQLPLESSAPNEADLPFPLSTGPSGSQLSAFNQHLLEIHNRLIKPTVSKDTGRTIRDHRAQEKLRKFLLTNPNPKEVTEFIFPAMEEHIDLPEFFKLEFPKTVNGRNARNTPGWQLRDDVKFEEIQEIVASNPSAAQLEAIKKPEAEY